MVGGRNQEDCLGSDNPHRRFRLPHGTCTLAAARNQKVSPIHDQPEQHSFRPNNSHHIVAAEVAGPDAAALLDCLSVNKLPSSDDGIRLVHMLTEPAGAGRPRARQVLEELAPADLFDRSFQWLTAQMIEVAGVRCNALTMSYVGELAWELHMPIDQMANL